MDYTEQSPIILSLCPGMLGLERGFERACSEINWKRPITAAYVEIEAFIVWNLVEQMEKGLLDSAPIHTNVKTFPYEILRGKVHGILGGYPCQPFSVAGKGKGIEDPRHLWPYIKSGINSIRPVFCFFENVRNHLNIGYEEVKGDLERLGYEVSEGIYSAEEVGAPHKRDRLFVLAIRKDELGNSENWNKLRNRIEEGKRQVQIGGSGNELGNTDSNGNEKGNAFRSGRRNKTKIEGKEIKRKRIWLESLPTSTTMADTNSSGSGEDTKLCELRAESIEQSPSNCWVSNKNESKERRFDSWPSRPGEDQYGWEEPRVKSSLGFTVNGYNFREDLLRMAGNGVVEQTAELAFLDLLKKHITRNKGLNPL